MSLCALCVFAFHPALLLFRNEVDDFVAHCGGSGRYVVCVCCVSVCVCLSDGCVFFLNLEICSSKAYIYITHESFVNFDPKWISPRCPKNPTFSEPDLFRFLALDPSFLEWKKNILYSIERGFRKSRQPLSISVPVKKIRAHKERAEKIQRKKYTREKNMKTRSRNVKNH